RIFLSPILSPPPPSDLFSIITIATVRNEVTLFGNLRFLYFLFLLRHPRVGDAVGYSPREQSRWRPDPPARPAALPRTTWLNLPGSWSSCRPRAQLLTVPRRCVRRTAPPTPFFTFFSSCSSSSSRRLRSGSGEVMASAVGLSSALGVLSVSASPSVARVAGPSLAASLISNPFLHNPISLSSSPPLPSSRVSLPSDCSFIIGSKGYRPYALAVECTGEIRNSYRIQGTALNEKEKVKVDDSFYVKSIPVHESRQATEDPAEGTPGVVERWIIKFEQFVNVALTESVIKVLDAFYHDRDYARFYVLETIARVPYFAFISVLHMYESFGWWRRADYLKVHFAESWNELHHLLIMEELGGNALWFDRLLAQHIAVFYYFMTVFMYAVSPRMAYHFSECVERHAYSTYDKFIKLHGDELKMLPAPEVAKKYYMSEDLYLFDEFQTARAPNTRRPQIENLYDVFVNIRDDEAEHCKTMKACQSHGKLQSPHSNPEYTEDDSSCVLQQADCEGIVDCIKKSLTTKAE
ncbi:hypothetical protein Taro_041299, partial [Colocasia esculenta]|nr:hypothetical protein [Colocasia esculenta]